MKLSWQFALCLGVAFVVQLTYGHPTDSIQDAGKCIFPMGVNGKKLLNSH